jgi:hypothetical protein
MARSLSRFAVTRAAILSSSPQSLTPHIIENEDDQRKGKPVEFLPGMGRHHNESTHQEPEENDAGKDILRQNPAGSGQRAARTPN